MKDNSLKLKETELGFIPEEWGVYSLTELADIIGGGTPRTNEPKYWNGNIPWLSVVDFNDDLRKVYSTEKFITKEGLENSSAKILRKGSLVISARGTVGALTQLGVDMAFNQSCYGLISKSIPDDLLYYLVKNAIADIKKRTHGSVFDTITKKTLDDIKLVIPKKEDERKQVAEILSSLDDKIELNNKINFNIEKLSNSIFKRWFIDFEFPDKNGKFYKSSGGRMINSELGDIPLGWDIVTIGDITDVIDCLHAKKPERSDINTGKVLLQLNNINSNGLLDLNEKYFICENDYKKWISRIEASDGDCVITNVGRVGAFSRIPYGIKVALGRNMTAIRSKPNFQFKSFIAQYFLSDLYRAEVSMNIDVGTILDALNVKNIPKLRLVIPKERNKLIEVDSFFASAWALREKIIINNQYISDIRDSLLPRLLNGKIRVKSI